MKIVLFALVSLSAVACVKPYQRELLAQPGMSFEPTPESASDQHLLESREASSGGFSAAGGGCGCN